MTNQQSDITIKVYNRGNLAGKIGVFFCTDNAKKLYEELIPDISKHVIDDNGRYMLAYDAAKLPNVYTFCHTCKLHYELIELN